MQTHQHHYYTHAAKVEIIIKCKVLITENENEPYSSRTVQGFYCEF